MDKKRPSQKFVFFLGAMLRLLIIAGIYFTIFKSDSAKAAMFYSMAIVWRVVIMGDEYGLH